MWPASSEDSTANQNNDVSGRYGTAASGGVVLLWIATLTRRISTDLRTTGLPEHDRVAVVTMRRVGQSAPGEHAAA